MDYVSIIFTHYSQKNPDDKKNDNIRSKIFNNCLLSLKENTNYSTEVIVIDNGGYCDDSDWLLNLVRKGIINHYIRNKDNQHWAWGWNKGVAIAEGNYIFLANNDILFKKNWLSETIKPLLEYPNKKLVACPMITRHNYNIGLLDNKYRLNFWGQPNAVLMKKSIYQEIGNHDIHYLAGGPWWEKLVNSGYVSVAPMNDYAESIGVGHGQDTKKENILIQKTLLNGVKITYKGIGYQVKNIKKLYELNYPKGFNI